MRAVRTLDADDDDAEALPQVGGEDGLTGERTRLADEHLFHVQLEVLRARGELHEIDDRRPERRLCQLQPSDLIRRHHTIGSRPLQLALGVVGLRAADDEQVGCIRRAVRTA